LALLVTVLLGAPAASAGPPCAASGAAVAAQRFPPELAAGSAVAVFFPPRPQAAVEEQRRAGAAYSGATLCLTGLIVGLSALFALQARAMRQLGVALHMGRRAARPQPAARPVALQPTAEVLQFRPRRQVDQDADWLDYVGEVEQILDRWLPPARWPVLPVTPGAVAGAVDEGDRLEQVLAQPLRAAG